MGQVTLPRARERAALALACGLHSAAFLALWGWALTQKHKHPAQASRVDDGEIELNLEFLTRPMPPNPSRRMPTTIARGAAEQHPGGGHRAGTPEPDAPAEDTSEPDPSVQNSDIATTPTRPIDLGLGADAWRKWVRGPSSDGIRTGDTSTTERTPRPTSSTGGLQEGLEEHDRQVGLGASGPAVSALYRAAHNPVAPETGIAHFRVTVLKSGAVVVSLSDATDQLPAWRAVATKAAEALRRAPPRIPEPRSGVRMVIEITAEEVFPNGVKQKELYDSRVEVKTPRFRSVTAAQANLKDLNPLAGEMGTPLAETKANVDLPGVFVGAKGKVCGYRAGITPLGPLLQGGCDIANLGTKPQRMVHTLVREETLF